MKSRLDELLHRYWEGKTSLAEEKELKEALRIVDGYEKEKTFFGALADYKSVEPQRLILSRKKPAKQRSLQWLTWAASLSLIVSSVWIWQDYRQKEEERLAYEEVMNALALIQTNLAKGQAQMEPLKDFKYLNTTKQLFPQEP
ncbi:hypothetical protein [Algoriphagus mannitolivorans]|uniref:hypothetical protein n=1 Tax=Algoriphagus mannitolivorans TaxID=226504 RepID=UPI00040ED8A5|nr:hypothetical protein [Algoriphagus mannitolivorans]